MFFVLFATCLFAAPHAQSEPHKVWGEMDVRDANIFNHVQFKRDYMMTNQPVIIRGDRRVLAMTRVLTVSKLLYLCGETPSSTEMEVLELTEDGGFYQNVRDRLNYTDGIVLEHIISQFSEDKLTIREFFEGSYFTKSIETEQDPRFPWALKDWSHPADFLWPPSLRRWRVGRCEKLVDFVQDVMKRSGARATAGVRESISAIPFVRAVLSGGGEHRPEKPADYMNLFASADMGRGTPAHLHGFPSHNLLLVVKGTKQMVTWPGDQADKLYPFMKNKFLTSKPYTSLFMANGFDVNLTRQPNLADVEGGLLGEAGPGDLIYIPCGVVHGLKSVRSTLVLNLDRRHSKDNCPIPPIRRI